MKKQLVASLAAAMVIGVAGSAFAASNPFVDVPANHWSYASVAKLAQAGIVDGYGDSTFRGDKTMSRYEMAQITAKAMAHSDKADAAQKAQIDKLAVEFADELQGLNVRTTALEKKISNIKFTGQLRQRMESTEDSKPNTEYKTRLRLMMTAPLNDNWTFKGRYGQESKAGEVNGNAQVDQAYVTGKAFGIDEVSFGRMPLYLGKGLVMDSSANWDGLKLTTGNKLKVSAGMVKKNFKAGSAATAAYLRPATSAELVTTPGTPYYTVNAIAAVDVDKRNFVFGNVAYDMNKNIDLTASYFADQGNKVTDQSDYETWAVGGSFKAIKNFAINAEYAVNSADVLLDDAKAAWAQVKYKGANADKVGSYGLWVGYTKAEAGFDPKGYTTRNGTSAKLLNDAGANDIKGYEYGMEYTLFKNGVLSLNYNPDTDYAGNIDKKFFLGQVTYGF